MITNHMTKVPCILLIKKEIINKGGRILMKKLKKGKFGEKGITLIALVIAIVVLLILARNNYKCTYWRKPAY